MGCSSSPFVGGVELFFAKVPTVVTNVRVILGAHLQ
jgi:hypothetical protein